MPSITPGNSTAPDIEISFIEQPAQTVIEEEVHELPRQLEKLVGRVLLGLMVLIPICFGGVHSKIYLPMQAIIFSLLAYVLVRGRMAIEVPFKNKTFRSSARVVLSCLICFVSYLVVQGVILALQVSPHPVLGENHRSLNLIPFWNELREVLFFTAAFVISCVFIGSSARRSSRLIKWLTFSGALVSLIALSHWLYDNGKLFWTFEPDNIFISDRARWPFVNPNHLAHFLLPVLFLLAASIVNDFNAISVRSLSKKVIRKNSFSLVLLSKSFQEGFIKIAFYSVLTLAVLLAIAGSLSRGGWLGLGSGVVFFLLIDRFSRRFKTQSTEQRSSVNSRPRSNVAFLDAPERRHRKRRKHSNNQKKSILPSLQTLSRMGRPLLVLSAALVFYFFLNGKGAELVQKRIEYGLMYSKDDMRWQMYADTLSMIKDHLILGVGIGNWAVEYNRYINPLLSGIYPVYLHSEPLQVLAETGIIGILPWIFLAGFILSRGMRILRAERGAERNYAMSLLCGLVALGVASCIDFPFRIPAISLCAAVYLAIYSFYIDQLKN